VLGYCSCTTCADSTTQLHNSTTSRDGGDIHFSSPSVPKFIIRTISGRGNDGGPLEILFDVPFTVPPPIYGDGDVPWSVDRHHMLPDVYGRVYRPS
jgi:hypothetical protein